MSQVKRLGAEGFKQREGMDQGHWRCSESSHMAGTWYMERELAQ